jgi:TolB-like protein/tetratricopeptide (TPR) repeat protein
VAEASHAVFLSYASQDAEAAQRICEALRAAGIEVWFDQSALRGGDVWDQTIRKQIKACVLFIPVLSKHTHDRVEGYFRLEWKLAIDRSHLIAPDQTFLLPVAIDNTREDDERVPDKFRDVHWTRLPGGETPQAFVERVRRLVSPEPSHRPTTTVSPAGSVSTATLAVGTTISPPKRALLAIVTVVVSGAVAYFAFDLFSKHPASPPTPPTAPASVPATTFAPPPHSIAVLPFVNLSGDASQDYFSDGLTEELLNSLAEIEGLQVAARTSSFSFKEHPDIATVAHKLNVGAVLEGSVRRSEHTVRVTAQLISAVTGFHLWSKTYDRDLGDVLKLQTEIATAVANALKVTLLGDVSTKIERGGTRNPAAFDAYLRAMRAYEDYHDDKGLQAAVAAFTESIQLDPGYALAYAARSLVRRQYLDEYGTITANRAGADTVRADALKAIALTPDLAEGHLALAAWLDTFRQDMTEASREYERAATLAPGNALVLISYALSAAESGRADAAITAAHRAVMLDPLSVLTRRRSARVLYFSRHYEEAIAAADETSSLDSGDAWAAVVRGQSHYLLGELDRARSSCDIASEFYALQVCRAIVYQRIGRRPEAEAALAKIQGDEFAYQEALIFAQWGNTAKALDWLDTGIRLHDTGLRHLKVEPLLDPLRKEPRFHGIERELKFPQ